MRCAAAVFPCLVPHRMCIESTPCLQTEPLPLTTPHLLAHRGAAPCQRLRVQQAPEGRDLRGLLPVARPHLLRRPGQCDNYVGDV